MVPLNLTGKKRKQQNLEEGELVSASRGKGMQRRNQRKGKSVIHCSKDRLQYILLTELQRIIIERMMEIENHLATTTVKDWMLKSQRKKKRERERNSNCAVETRQASP